MDVGDSQKTNAPNLLSLTVVVVHHGAVREATNQFEVEDIDSQGSLHIPTLRSWDTLLELSNKIAASLGIPVEDQRLFFRGEQLVTLGQTLSQSHIHSGATIDVQDTRENDIVEVFGYTSVSGLCKAMVDDVIAGFRRDFKPKLSSEGTGATYFLNNGLGEPTACFKPLCEEQSAPNNPRGNPGELGSLAMERSIRSGEMSFRETAAYILDNSGFHDVPKTTTVEIRNPKYLKHFHYENPSLGMGPKIGSLQEFVTADAEYAEQDPRFFSVREVHKIGILDVRLLNCDRNDENILTVRDRDGRVRLIPIDHGLCFPDTLEIGWCDWTWANWPQAKENFDPFTLNFINSIDVEEDIERLSRELPLSLAAMDNIRISGMLLQIGACHGLTLYEIAKIILRQNLDEPSELELLRAQAEKLTSHRNYRHGGKRDSLLSIESPPKMKKVVSDPQVHDDSEKTPGTFVQGIDVFRDDGTASHMFRTQSCIDISHQAFPQMQTSPFEDTGRQGIIALIPSDSAEVSSDLQSLDLADRAVSAHTMNVRIASSRTPRGNSRGLNQDDSENQIEELPPRSSHHSSPDHTYTLPNSYSST